MISLEERITSLPEEKRILLAQLLGEKNAIFNKITPVHTFDKTYPCSYAQNRMWLQATKLGKGHVSNITLALNLNGICDLEILEESIKSIIERHDSLRTSFQHTQNEVKQYIDAEANFKLPIFDYKVLREGAFKKVLDRFIRHEQRKSFDLTKAPLIRGGVFKHSRDNHVLVLVFHHATFDGWSINLFCKELFGLYNSLIDGSHLELSRPILHQGDFCLWEKKIFESSEYPEILSKVKRYIGGDDLSKTSLLINKQVPEELLGNEFIDIELPLELKLKLKKICAEQKTTLYILLLTIFSTSLSCILKNKKFFIGTPIAGRAWKNFENTIGMFVNAIPVKIEIDNDISLADQLKQIQHSAAECYEFQNWSFDKIKADLGLKANESWYQVFFALQNTFDITDEMKGIAVSPYHMEGQPLVNRILQYYSPLPNYLGVSLAMSERATGIAGTIEYNPAAISLHQVKKLIATFFKVVNQIADHSDVSMQALCNQATRACEVEQ